MAQRLRVSDWETTVDELRRFGESGDVSVDDDRIRIDFGSASVEMGQDGRINAGMPLHDFEQDSESELIVDHDAGSLTVKTRNVTYTFRRPSR